MVTESRYAPLPASERCGVPGCWCTPKEIWFRFDGFFSDRSAEPTPRDYGTRPAREGERLVPRDLIGKAGER